jgi:hypothetical protein
MYRLILTAALGVSLLSAQDEQNTPQIPVSDPVCSFFGPQMANFFSGAPTQSNGGQTTAAGLVMSGENANIRKIDKLTRDVAALLPPPPGGGRTGTSIDLSKAGMIDQYLFSAMQSAGVQPADTTTDWEFVRRVTLDLTGRIPTPGAVLSFVNSTSPTKRSDLVEQLLASGPFVDKWTMYLGDLFKNVSQNSQITTYPSSVEAFYQYIKASVASDKPYDQLAREIIAASGPNSYDTTNGQINFIVGGVVTGGPVQDIFDQQTANIADVFLGISHLNCLLCHNGAGHLTGLSLWGQQQTRYNAWGMAAFLSHTSTTSTAVAPPANTPRYWGVADTIKQNYQLNTTTGNRPPRQPVGTLTSVSPTYIFNGAVPAAGQNYRTALAQMITSDPQFARAAVNYYWAYFFGVGLVDPPDTFDPDRLDPDSPPPASSGFALQPSNPRLLNALAAAFAANGYDVKWLMRQIVNSQAYQLSVRYDGNWNPAWASLYARKNVRRLWGEELHDAIAISSQYIPTYEVGSYGQINYAMQFPETINTPDGANGHISMWLDSFLRGNRDNQPRSPEGSILQALNLMNDTFVVGRTSTGTPEGALLPANINLSNSALVNTLFLNVLSRYPSATEMSEALQNLSSPLTRNQEAQNLLWSLYNKVDFIFNY